MSDEALKQDKIKQAKQLPVKKAVETPKPKVEKKEDKVEEEKIDVKKEKKKPVKTKPKIKKDYACVYAKSLPISLKYSKAIGKFIKG